MIDELDLDLAPEELAEIVSVSAPLNTTAINITVTDADPQLAADIQRTGHEPR